MTVDFSFSPEQVDLRETVRDFLAKHGIRERTAGQLDRALWTKLTAELGLTGIGVPEATGGAGAGLVEVAIVIEEAGRALLAAPYLATVAAAASLDGPELHRRVVDGAVLAVADGDRVTSAGDRLTGEADLVLDGDVAEIILVAAVDGLFAVRASDATVTGTSTMDLSRAVARVTFSSTPATRLHRDPVAAVDVLRVLLAVESLGVAAASLERTVAHLASRRQFGAPLASFQALRHRVADLAVQVEAATSSAWYAVRSAAAGELTHDLAIVAQLVATRAAYLVTAQSIQLHGGIGFTWEHDAHRYFKRATVNRYVLGGPQALRRALGDAAL